MEHKSSYVLVGAITVAIVVALFGFILWLSNSGSGEQRRYDILFGQSVSGLAIGSQVQYSGVPVGSVEEIRLIPDRPEYVRVRISIDENVPVLIGTTALLDSVGFTGVAMVQLDGAMSGAKPITAPGPYGVPLIPTRPGALGQLLSNAPQLVERLSTLAERLGAVLDDRNRDSIAGILANTSRISGALAGRSNDIAATLAEARGAVTEIGIAATEIGKLANATTTLVDAEGRPLIADLRATVQRADRTLTAFEAAANSARPAAERINSQTLPEVEQLVRDLQTMTTQLGAIAAKLDEDPAGALVGGRSLPTYDPDNAKK